MLYMLVGVQTVTDGHSKNDGKIMNKFPDIPNVQFKLISKDGFGNYAVSSDGRIWNGNGGRWRAMETYTSCDGEEAVWLNRIKVGGAMFKVKKLMEEAF